MSTHTISTCPHCGQEMHPTDYHARLQAINAELLAENKKLGRISAELKAACESFLEAQDSPAPRDLLVLAAIQASNALAKATS